MLIADSHEFIEMYRGSRDLRLGMELVRQRDDVRFVSFGPDVLSPSDVALRGVRHMADIELPRLPDRMELRTLPGTAVRFARKEAGGKFSLMRGFRRSLVRLQPDVIIGNSYSWLTPRSYAIRSAAKRLGVPFFFYDAGDEVPISAKQQLALPMERPVIADAFGLMTFNEAGKRRFVAKYGYPPERIHVIPKPVDVAQWRPAISSAEAKVALGLPAGAFVVAYVGRLARVKGSRTLADIAELALADGRMAHWRFLFLGGTLDSAEDERDYRLPNTHLTGMLPNEKVPEVLAAADVVAFPDVAHPGGFWTSIAEAMAAGKPIVLGTQRNQDFVPVLDGKTALIVPPSDTESLLHALTRLHEDVALRERLGSAVGRFAEEHMDYPRVAQAYLELLDGAVAAHA